MSSVSQSKGKRSTNFSKIEEEKLLRLVYEKRHILENRKTDANTSRHKNDAWEIIALQYNAYPDTEARSVKVLREKYKNYKRAVRVSQEINRKEKRKDGEGDGPTPTESEENSISNPLFEQELIDQICLEVPNPPIKCEEEEEDDDDDTFNEQSNRCDESARMVSKITVESEIAILKKRLLEQQLEHARLEHEQKMKQSDEEHKLRIQILQAELIIKQSEQSKKA